MADSRTVRARVNQALATQVDAVMEREGRTESDVLRRALEMYCGVTWVAGYPVPGRVTTGGKPFKGMDPK